jgi:predicted acylesterase/phospholipase RssA/CRP-like cAMP-binding protein
MQNPRSERRRSRQTSEEPSFQRIDKIHVLRLCQLFKRLSHWELSSVSRLTRVTEFKKNEVVYRAGENPKLFYIVISGRFEAFLERDGKKEALAYLKQGAYFGEMSLLSDATHSSTVQALSDSLVLIISKHDFKKIVESNAAVSLEISRVLSARVQAKNKGSSELPHLLKSDVIAVYSAHRTSDHTAFSVNLAASLHHETHQKTLLIDMSPSGQEIFDWLRIHKKADVSVFKQLEKNIDGILANHLIEHTSGIDVLNLATESAGSKAAELTTHLLNRLSVDFRFIVIDLPNKIDDMVIKVMSQADHLFFVTDNSMANVSEVQEIIQELEKTVESSDDKTKIIINESLLGFAPTQDMKEQLFGKKDCYFLPSIPLKFLEGETKSLIVLEQPDMHYSQLIRRVARKISKNLIGLALGSGAALGFAHIGILKVLEREKIPIDYIAGSSMGALIGAFYATGKKAAELEKIASKFNMVTMISRIDLSIPPIRGFITGNRILGFLKRYLKDATFEDTRIPLLVVGTNLDNRSEVVISTGDILSALRASISIPGVFHPVKRYGDTLVDGGVINPLPVRTLTDIGVNKIIAVDVLPTTHDILTKRRYSDELDRRMRAIIRRRNPLIQSLYHFRQFLRKLFVPNLVDIIVNSMQVMEHEIANSVASEADVLIRPNMPLLNWIDFHKSQEIIKCGEVAADSMTEELHTLVRQQNF